jgi:hypothetical protein
VNYPEIPKNQYDYISQFTKDSLEGFEREEGVLKVVYVCWFSHRDYTPVLHPNRFQALKTIVNNIGVPVLMITQENFPKLIRDGDSIHEGFNYLSANHKSDYVRAYMLHHYGGGYHDVKFRKLSWEKMWKKFGDEKVWIISRREKHPKWVGHPPGQKHIRKHFRKLGTMSWVILRDHTPYSQELYDSVHVTLDKHLEELKKHPAHKPRCCYGGRRKARHNSYPLRYLELMGEIFHPLMLKYNEHIGWGLKDIRKHGVPHRRW